MINQCFSELDTCQKAQIDPYFDGTIGDNMIRYLNPEIDDIVIDTFFLSIKKDRDKYEFWYRLNNDWDVLGRMSHENGNYTHLYNFNPKYLGLAAYHGLTFENVNSRMRIRFLVMLITSKLPY